MIKKVLILGVLLFATMGFVACNGSTLPTDLTTPNLTTTGSPTTTEAPDTTTTTTVPTTPTTTVTTADPVLETATINAILESMEIVVPAAFAGTLVSHGMTSSEFSLFIAAFMNLVATASATQDPTVVNTALKAFLAGDYNYEALLAAGMLMLPVQIDEEIASVNEDIAALDPLNEFYAENLAGLQQELAMMQTMKTAVLANEEEMLVVAVNTVDYLIAFQADIDNDLLSDLITLSTGTMTSISEIMLIKHEVVAVLMENLPAVADMVLIDQLMLTFEEAFMGTSAFTTQLGLLSTESATATRLCMQLILEFAGSIDEAFVTSVMTTIGAQTEEALIVRDMILLVADYVDDFMVDQAVLIAQLSAVYTDAQIETLVNSLISSLVTYATAAGAPADVLAMITLITTNLNYDLLIGSADVVAELAMNLFTYFRTSEGELVELILEVNGFYSEKTVESSIFKNDYLNVVYLNYTAYNLAEEQATVRLIDELFNYANAVMSDLSAADIDAFVNLIIAVLPQPVIVAESGLTAEQVSALVTLIDGAITDQSANALAFLNAFIDYVVVNDVVGDAGLMRASVAAYYTTLYGADFKWTEGYGTDSSQYDMITSILFACQQIDPFLTETNLGYLNAVSAELFDVLSDPNMLLVTKMTIEAVNAMETNINGAGVAFRNYVTAIKDFPAYELLTVDQKNTIFAFATMVQSIVAPSTPA